VSLLLRCAADGEHCRDPCSASMAYISHEWPRCAAATCLNMFFEVLCKAGTESSVRRIVVAWSESGLVRLT
jgi:hypothetical protein